MAIRDSLESARSYLDAIKKLSMHVCVSFGCVPVVFVSTQAVAEQLGCMNSNSAELD